MNASMGRVVTYSQSCCEGVLTDVEEMLGRVGRGEL